MTSQTDLTQRMAMSSAEAAAGYAKAAVAAYVDFTSQVMGFWANTFDSMMGTAQPRSWYRHPDAPGRSQPVGTSGAAWMPMMAPGFAGAGFGNVGAAGAILNPFSLWMQAWPLQGNPAAWPMAFMLMGMGVSRSVAYPLAEANTAAVEAVNSATRVAQESFSRYRSDGGHATAQIRVQSNKPTAAMMVPLGMQAFAPWLNAFAALPRTI